MAGKSSKRSSQGTSTVAGLIGQLSKRLSLSRELRDREKIRSAVERYLDSLHYTTYAYWDISNPERRAMAVEWLTDQVIAVLSQTQHD